MAIRHKDELGQRWTQWQRTGRARLSTHYQKTNQRSGGRLALFVETWHAFNEDDGGTRAAAIGYYALLSLFPLTVLLALVLGYLMGESVAALQINLIASRYLPLQLDVLDDIVHNVFANRGTLSTLAVVGIAWSGMQLFRVLERAINRAWGAPRRRGFWRNLAFAVAMVSITGILTLLSIGLTALFEIVHHSTIRLPFLTFSPLQNPFVWEVVSALPPFALTMALFTLLYRLVPHRVRLSWHDVWPAALLASTLWEGAKQLFAFYLAQVVRQNYSLIYGSVGFLLALLTWVYVTAYIVLMGAEFCAVLARYRRERATTRQRGQLAGVVRDVGGTLPPQSGEQGG